MLRKRPSTSTTLLAWTVVKTRWPVSAEHGVFAMHGGHDGNAEIDEAAFVAHPETAVLGHAALGDVELRHDLDTRENGGVVLACDGREGHLEHAVDAVLDDH